jgi:hypothetical protein
LIDKTAKKKKEGKKRNPDSAFEKLKAEGMIRLQAEGGDELEAVNERFNEALDKFKAGTLKPNEVLHLGAPLEILQASGVKNGEITVTQTVLKDKLKQHGLTVEDLKGLAKAIQTPIMVYEWGTKAKSTIIVSELTTEDGRKITIAVKAERNGKNLSVNEVASVHGKAAERFLSEMENAKEGGLKEALRYVQKEKALDWLGMAPPMGATQANQELNSIAKIIQEFQNPKLSDEKTHVSEKKPTPITRSGAEALVRELKKKGFIKEVVIDAEALREVVEDDEKGSARKKVITTTYNHSSVYKAFLKAIENNNIAISTRNISQSTSSKYIGFVLNGVTWDFRFANHSQWMSDTSDATPDTSVDFDTDNTIYNVHISVDELEPKSKDIIGFINWVNNWNSEKRDSLPDFEYIKYKIPHNPLFAAVVKDEVINANREVIKKLRAERIAELEARLNENGGIEKIKEERERLVQEREKFRIGSEEHEKLTAEIVDKYKLIKLEERITALKYGYRWNQSPFDYAVRDKSDYELFAFFNKNLLPENKEYEELAAQEDRAEKKGLLQESS